MSVEDAAPGPAETPQLIHPLLVSDLKLPGTVS